MAGPMRARNLPHTRNMNTVLIRKKVEAKRHEIVESPVTRAVYLFCVTKIRNRQSKIFCSVSTKELRHAS